MTFTGIIYIFCPDYHNFKCDRGLKILGGIKSPPLAIPGTEGTVAYLACIMRDKKFRGHGHLKEEETKFRITLKSTAALRLAGSVDVTCEGISLRGILGDKETDQFCSKDNNSWTFLRERDDTEPFCCKLYKECFPLTSQNKVMHIKLSLFSFIPESVSHAVSALEENVSSTELGQNMKKLLQNPKHADVILKCQKEEIRCHKNILEVRAPVLYKMLDVDRKEKNLGVLEIDDIDPGVLKAVIELIYTGDDVTEHVDDLASLIYAGVKYELKGLIDHCNKKFLDTNDKTKIVEIFILADRYSLHNIKEVAMTKMAKDVNIFLKDQEFKNQMEKFPKLLLEFVCSMNSTT